MPLRIISAPAPKTSRPGKQLFWGLFACFLLGILLLFILSAEGKLIPPTSAAEGQLLDRQSGQWLKIYGETYFSFFLQASLLLAAGLSGLGIFLLPLLFLVYGGATLYGILSFYYLNGVSGLIQYWQMFWLPSLGNLLLLCLIGSKVFGTAIYLGKSIIKKVPESGKVPYKPAILCYLLCLVAGTPVSAASVVLGRLFI